MDNKYFSDEDKNNFIALLNMVTKHASFNLTTDEIIKYYKLLNYVQTQLLPKIEDNIFKIEKVTNPKDTKE